MKNTDGIALFEVLVSMSLLGLILYPFFIDQINNFKSIDSIYFKTIAFIQLENFEEELRANQTNSARAQAFLDWNQDNMKLLPQGIGTLDQTSNHICNITIQWLDKTWQKNLISITC